MSESDHGAEGPLSLEGIDEEVLRSLSSGEHLAVQRQRHWRFAWMATMALCVGLLVVVVMLVSQRQVQYVQVSQGLDERVQLLPWTDRPWMLTETQTRNEIERWLKSCRKFGTDASQLAWDRYACWQQAYHPAQRWVKAWFDALPVTDVGKVGIRVAQPPLPAMKSVPPAAGRTWEVFWEEEWSRAQSPLVEHKVFVALITVQVKAPTTDAEATFLGVWIENITIEERLSTPLSIP